MFWGYLVPVRPWDDVRLSLWGETAEAVITDAGEDSDFGDDGRLHESYWAAYAFETASGQRAVGETRGSGGLAVWEGERVEVEYLPRSPGVNRPALTGGPWLPVRVLASLFMLAMCAGPGAWLLWGVIFHQDSLGLRPSAGLTY